MMLVRLLSFQHNIVYSPFSFSTLLGFCVACIMWFIVKLFEENRFNAIEKFDACVYHPECWFAFSCFLHYFDISVDLVIWSVVKIFKDNHLESSRKTMIVIFENAYLVILCSSKKFSLIFAVKKIYLFFLVLGRSNE